MLKIEIYIKNRYCITKLMKKTYCNIYMIKNEIKMKCEDAEVFGKKQIALAIRNSIINDDIECSLLMIEYFKRL